MTININRIVILGTLLSFIILSSDSGCGANEPPVGNNPHDEVFPRK